MTKWAFFKAVQRIWSPLGELKKIIAKSRPELLPLCKDIVRLPMSELVEIVDSLENKISKLLHKMDLLQQSKLELEREMQSLRSEYEAAQRSVEEWEEKYKSLKLANSMLGSETNKTEAKLKINQLIRELDHCIVQLAE